jgi:ubiquinone/menaquinone biosynthesis C-methylase UbiE
MSDSISRFSRTVENYIKYRPTYPQAMVEFLQGTCQLTRGSIVADIGSGTGLLSEAFLQNGYCVLGVEPNPDMRLASQQLLRKYPNFNSVEATAEETTLPQQSIDLITAGQAFGWFDRKRSRAEFTRILKSDGWVALAWNIPRDNTPFLVAYNKIWQKYLNAQSHHSGMDTQSFDNELRAWYAPGSINIKIFDNAQVVDFEGLKGRVLSSSFAPTSEQSHYQAMLAELKVVFQAHEIAGNVTIEYDCRVCYGQFQ